MTIRNVLAKLQATRLSRWHVLAALPIVCVLVFLSTFPVSAATPVTPATTHGHKPHYSHFRTNLAHNNSTSHRSQPTHNLRPNATNSANANSATSTTTNSATKPANANPASTTAANNATTTSTSTTAPAVAGTTSSTTGPSMPFTGSDPDGNPIP